MMKFPLNNTGPPGSNNRFPLREYLHLILMKRAILNMPVHIFIGFPYQLIYRR